MQLGNVIALHVAYFKRFVRMNAHTGLLLDASGPLNWDQFPMD